MFWFVGSVFIYNYVLDISQSMNKAYSHPFIVSNSARQIMANVTAMHRHMKDVALSENSDQLLRAIRYVDNLEQRTLQEFKTIQERYLGNKKDVQQSYDLFIAWRDIRQEVIELTQSKQKKVAIKITKVKVQQHVDLIIKKITVLVNYAANKANEFQQQKNIALRYIIIILCLMILFAILISVYFISTFIRSNRGTLRALHLIDQNIMMAYFDKAFKVKEVSQELTRTFNIPKKQLLGSIEKNFFFEDTSNDAYLKMKKSIDTGVDWSGEIRRKINNEQRWFTIKITTEYNLNYLVKGYTVILSDISDKKQIEEVSITDILTKLYNRNYFELILPKEINRAHREKKAVSLIIMDIDFFKQYNDTYGHLQGDVALKEVANNILQKVQRSYDYAFRIGGEEFAILFQCDNYEDSLFITEGIKGGIEGLAIPHKTSAIADHLTVSLGMACFKKPDNHSRDEMFKEVDDLLYQAKDKGRNQICSVEIDF